MHRAQDTFQSYSWHQSHDQATVLLLVPYDTVEEDVAVVFDRNYLVAGVRGQPPIVKGRLYGHVDVAGSLWQLEPRASRLTARERTTSTTSTTSTHSSFALVSETEVSSRLATSVEGGFFSEFDESLSSPALSSPVSLTAEDAAGFPIHNAPRRHARFTTSHPVSPRPTNASLSLASSFSSLESLHGSSGRLLTIHVEKAESMIWPSLIVGPVPETLAPQIVPYPWPSIPATEHRYNMDATSLVLIGLDLFDIRDDKEEAFEYFTRAWHQAHPPSATMRIASHYLPVNAPLPAHSTPDYSVITTLSTSDASSLSAETTPVLPHANAPTLEEQSASTADRTSYYLHRLGGPDKLAQLYLEAGLLFLEGTASGLLSSSFAGLSSLRTPTQSQSRPSSYDHASAGGTGSGGGSDAWRRDQDYARRYFDRARQLHPELDVPLLQHSEPSSDHESNATASSRDSGSEPHFQMPTIDLPSQELPDSQPRRRRKKETFSGTASATSAVEERTVPDDDDGTWYLYLPGLVGAGTALLIVGFLSFSSWRKGQGS